jgi:hypothetical protein
MKKNNDGFFLSLYPIPLTPSEVKSLLVRLEQNDEMAKKLIICLIEHRLNHRYIRPLLNVPKEYKSGFLIMASACLLIETLQSFYEGKNQSDEANENPEEKEKGSERSFIKFFEERKNFFPAFRDSFPIELIKGKKGKLKEKCTFYKNIRCGIFHQAETTGGYSISRKGLLFSGKKINANKFIESLERCLNKYIDDLRVAEPNSRIWKKAIKKMNHVCDNCQS